MPGGTLPGTPSDPIHQGARMRSILDKPAPLATVPESPPARRGQPPRWRDPRVLAGALLIIGATLAGALLWSGGTEGTAVWRMVRDLPAGAPVTPADVEAVVVVVPEGTSYLAAEVLPEGRLGRAVAAGELLPADATSAVAPADVRLVTVPVEPMHAPVDITAGSVVDVWSTAEGDIGGVGTTELVLAQVRVDAVLADAEGVSGALAVVLEVATEDAPVLVAAARGGVIDLVAVPAVP